MNMLNYPPIGLCWGGSVAFIRLFRSPSLLPRIAPNPWVPIESYGLWLRDHWWPRTIAGLLAVGFSMISFSLPTTYGEQVFGVLIGSLFFYLEGPLDPRNRSRYDRIAVVLSFSSLLRSY